VREIDKEDSAPSEKDSTLKENGTCSFHPEKDAMGDESGDAKGDESRDAKGDD
jgi:hypothetical protein